MRFGKSCLGIALISLVLRASLADAPPAPGPWRRDVVYSRAGGVDLKLDLCVPAGEGPFPLIVCLHGGAWRTGDKSKYAAAVERFAARGYAAATVNYRLAPDFKYPAQLEDARAAVRFLRAHAARWKIDPAHVGATGESAGAHLALLLGLMDDTPVDNAAVDDAPVDDAPAHPERHDGATAGNPIPSTKVQAVVNCFGPTDFPRLVLSSLTEYLISKRTGGHTSADAIADFLGTRDRAAAVMAAASPVTYVSPDDPPVLTFHGILDPLVPIRQAEGLHAALKQAGAPETLVEVPNAFHGGWDGPERERTDRLTLEFFDRYLKGDLAAWPDKN